MWERTATKQVAAAGLLLGSCLVLKAAFQVPELRWNQQFHLEVYPGQSEAEVIAAVGQPRHRLEAGDPYLETIYRSGNYQPVPTVRGWARALVYTHLWYLQVIYLDAAGRVLCLVTSAT